MKTEENLGSVKRFGARYGRKPKLQFSKIEAEQRKKHKCPYCNKISVKRVSVGIWHCNKCDAKFTGKAYSVTKKIVVRKKEETEEEAPVVEEDNQDTEEEIEAQ